MTINDLRQKFRTNPTFLNNFHGLFPGGYRRAMDAEVISNYFSRLGEEPRNITKAEIDAVPDRLMLWAKMDKEIQRLGYSISDVREWECFGDLIRKHLDLVLQIYLFLLGQGYDHDELVG